MNVKSFLTLACLGIASFAAAQTNNLQSRALWASINGTKNASLGDYQQHTGKVLVTWRMLPSDNGDTAFDLYRTIGTEMEHLIASNITATNYQDASASKTADNTYRLTYAGSNETIGTYTLPQAQVSGGLPYISIPLRDTKDVYANTDKIVYTANDVSVGDLDDDGEYEIVVKRLQSVKDEDGNVISDGSGASYSQQDCLYAVIWDAYRLDGTFLWRIKGGPGIILGNSSSFAIADFNGDGCAEMAIRTCEGTVFGDGTAIGDTNGDGKIDYRTWGNLGTSNEGYVDHYNSAGPEFISIIDGKTGRELARDNFIDRETSLSWGDGYWKRACSFRIGVGCFDNTGLPSVVLGRGVYAHSVIEAWDYRNGTLSKRWRFDTNNSGYGKDGNANSAYAGQGNHSLNVTDLDGDGLDEVMYGSMAVDHDGIGLWTTKLGHGDANHVGKFLPARDGLQMYHCLESGKTMVALHDAKTGAVIWKKDADSDNDMGRCLVADIDPNSPGCEFWYYGSNAYSQDGATDLGYKPASCNMAIWFDGTLSRQLINENIIHSPANGRTFTMYRYSETFINGTKSNPSWYGDILGDWREEVILPDATRLQDLKIFSTWYPTTHRFPWLMTDHTYWMSALNENIGYNQPTNVGYYLGSDLTSDEEAWAAAKEVMNANILQTPFEVTIGVTGMANYAGMGTIYPATKKSDYYLPVVGVTTTNTNGMSVALSGTFTTLDGTTTSIGNLSTYTFTQLGTLTITATVPGYPSTTSTFSVGRPYYKLYESPDYSTIAAADAQAVLGGSFSSEPYISRWSYWSKYNATYGDSYVMVSSGKDSGYLDDDQMLYFSRTNNAEFHLVQGFGIGHNYNKANTIITAKGLGNDKTIVYHKADRSRGGETAFDTGYTYADSDGTWTYELYQNTTFCQFAAYLPVTVLIGDLNHDGYVNITDVVILSNYILGNEGNVFKFEADLNGDGSVNITDIVTLTNLVLNQ